MSLGIRERQALEGTVLDPRTLPGLEAWYDAQYVNGFGVASPSEGAPLAQWNDLSGKNRHLVQATAGARPIWHSVATMPATRTNLLTNPSFEGGVLTPWNNGTASTDYARVGTYSLKGTSVSSGQIISTMGVGTGKPLALNTTYTYSAWLYRTSASVATASIRAGNAGTSTPINSPFISSVGEWTRVSLTFTTSNIDPSTVSFYGILPGGISDSTGVYADCYLLEQGSDLLPYFDGSSSDSAAYTTAWTGTPNASTSVATLKASDPRGLPAWVEFDGINDGMATASSLGIGPSPVSMYAVANYMSPTIAGSKTALIVASLGGAGVAAPRAMLYASNNRLIMYGATNADLPPLFVTGTPLVASGWGDGVDSTASAINGLPLTIAASGMGATDLSGPLYISNTAGAQTLYGTVSAALVFSVKHDEATRHKIEQWLAARYGIALARP